MMMSEKAVSGLKELSTIVMNTTKSDVGRGLVDGLASGTFLVSIIVH